MLNKVRSTALDLLARREHSKFELEQKLRRKNFALDDIEKVLETLARKGLQSDVRFIENYIAMRSRKGYGPLRIRLELEERGIDKETIGRFLSELDPVWFERALILRIKKFGEKHPANLKEKAKQARYLNYKGFTGDHISRVLSHKGSDPFFGSDPITQD